MMFLKQKQSKNNNQQQSLRRLQTDLQDEELKELNDDTCIIEIKMINDLLYLFMAPKIGFYQNQNFLFTLDFRTNYPYCPPFIKSESDIPHPNIVQRNKQVYLKFLEQQNWRPIYGLIDIIKELKQTLIYIDFTYIPNELDCLILAQNIQNQNQSYPNEFIDFEISENFKSNFELDQTLTQAQENQQNEKDSQSYSQYMLSQLPAIINLQKTIRHTQNDQIFYINLKN